MSSATSEVPGKDPKPTDPNAPPVAPGVGPDGEEVEELVHISFWQKKWVQDILPFGTSIALHAGLILLAWATYKAVEQVVTIVKEQIIIPDAAIVEGAQVGGIPNPGLGGDPTRPAAQDKYPDVSVTSEGWASEPSEKLTATLMGGGSGDAEGSSMIGVGAGSSIGGKGRGVGSGTGDGTGSGNGDGGGPLAPFGIPGGGGGIGPKSPFMGVSGNARMVCYVSDASGSMMQKFDLLKIELTKAVNSLRPIQAFNIIFFQEGAAAAANKQGLMMANGDNKKKAFDFLADASLAANSDPIPAIKLAFQQKPQLIYLLTDGEFPNNDAVIAEIAKLNADKSVKINTIAFANPNEEDAAYVQVLQRIAKDNGGVFKFVTASDLVK